MHYFEFYDLPVSFQMDLDVLKRKYYEISRSVHPDFHTLASESLQEAMLEKSTVNNRAYKTLSDFDQRLKYILDLFGKLKEEGENKVPQDFLMEMMELNESLMELEMEASDEIKGNLLTHIRLLEKQALNEIQLILEVADVSVLTNDEWNGITDYYLKSRYLKRLLDNINNMKDNT
ncbi:MAG: Fe-S protein assembly co-chaperone HscB [Saprospiraceae bacterium]|nr:Fe-S protein assembly co-chaperone HscB [Saprospiraceae bacterium]